MDKYAVWVRGNKRLPGLFDKVKWRNADGGNIPLGEATPLEHYQRTGANINWHEWLDEFPVDRGVEKAAVEYVNTELRMYGAIGEYTKIFIAGAKWAGNDAVEFADWKEDNHWWRDDETKLWCKASGLENLTTEQLYNLFKQKQL